MNPLAALIGAGASIIGGLMNTSSTQAINAANIQNQIWSAQGGYLPGLVQNAKQAGLNPLAVLGSRGPNMAVQVGEQPGAGLQQAAASISRMDEESYENQLQLQREEIAQRAAVNKNTMIDNAVKQEMWRRLSEHPEYIPPGWGQPASDTSLQGSAIKWMSGKTLGDVFYNPSGLNFHDWANNAQVWPRAWE